MIFDYPSIGYLIMRIALTVAYSSLIGLPVVAYILPSSEKSFLVHILASVSASAMIVYVSVFSFAYFLTFNVYSIIITLAIFMLPLCSKKTIAKFKSFKIRLRIPEVPNFFILIIGSISLSLILLIFTVALRSEPALNDPYAVWLYLGKEIYTTSHVPLFFGRYADISWSGNYPPISAFYAAFMFTSLYGTDPRDFTLIPFIFGFFTVITVYLIIKIIGGDTSAALIGSLILLLSSIFAFEMMGWGYVDILSSCFISLFVLFTFLARRSENYVPYLIIGSISLGDLLLDKYTSLIYLPFLIIFILALEPRLRGVLRHPLANMSTVLILIIPILIAFSWYMRNLILLGDPVYPFLNSIFHARGILPIYFDGLKFHTINIFSFFQDRTFISLTNAGDEYPFIVFGGIGAFYFLGTKQSYEFRMLSGLALALFFSLLLYAYFNLSYVRYFVDLIPLFAVLGGMLFLTISSNEKSDGFELRNESIPIKEGSTSKASNRNQFKAILMVALLIFMSISTITVISENAIKPPDYRIPTAYNVLDSLPNGTVLTNSILRFFINKEVVAAEDVPQLFLSPNSTYILSVLENLSIRYIFYAPDFTPFPTYLTNLLHQVNADNSTISLLNSSLISTGFSIWVVNYN